VSSARREKDKLRAKPTNKAFIIFMKLPLTFRELLIAKY
jgi:hypothetical protein